jgi:hypothetical protein
MTRGFQRQEAGMMIALDPQHKAASIIFTHPTELPKVDSIDCSAKRNPLLALTAISDE